MKLIIAYIQPYALNEVKQALYDADVKKISITNSMGCGQQGGLTGEFYRGVEVEVTLHKKVRIEIAVNDNFVKLAVDAIIKGSRSGEIGDGKIFIVPIEECIRIRTGETGAAAIG
jgi:nitrogen regulatory protein P-II 1